MRLRKLREHMSKTRATKTPKEITDRSSVEKVLDKLGVDPKDIDMRRVRIKVGQHSGFIKNAAGEVELVNNIPSARAYISPVNDTPEWPVVQQPPPITVKYAPPLIRRTKTKTAIVTCDQQIGYWRDFENNVLIPFHDEAAMDIALQIMDAVRPTRHINGGDLLDNPELQSKFRRYPEFVGMAQPSLLRAKIWLADAKAHAGKQCEHDLVEGNHEARWVNAIIDNGLTALHATKTAWLPVEVPPEWPINSIPNILQLEKLGVRYSAAYPGGDVWLNKFLVFQHQDAKINREERATVIHGHIHRASIDWKTVYAFGQQLERGVISVPALCRNDEVVDNLLKRLRSSVPADKVRHNWQQGLLVIHYLEDGGPADFEPHLVRISNGSAMYNGVGYTARVAKDHNALAKYKAYQG